MQEPRRALGKGLSALLGEVNLKAVAEVAEPAAYEGIKDAQYVITKSLKVSAFQPRQQMNEEEFQALVESVAQFGVLQPILVRKNKENTGYEIVAGERRWRAALALGLETVPVIVKNISDQETLEIALVENLIRQNLNPIEEAEGFSRLIHDFNHTQENIAKVIGRSRSHVANTLRLLQLPHEVKDYIAKGELSSGHARTLIGVEDPKDLAEKIVKRKLNVRQAEALVKKQLTQKAKPISQEKPAKPEELKRLEAHFSRYFSMKGEAHVSIDHNMSTNNGKIIISYQSINHLNEILKLSLDHIERVKGMGL